MKKKSLYLLFIFQIILLQVVYSQSIEYIKSYAEKGDERAQCNLGMKYLQGDGVKKDLGEAVKWFKKSAEQGNTKAQFEY